MIVQSPRSETDRGSVLIIVFLIVVVLGAVIVAVASSAPATLRYGRVVESRSDRLAAAQAATDDAIEQLELKRAFSLCATDAGTGAGTTHQFPETIQPSTSRVALSTVRCRRRRDSHWLSRARESTPQSTRSS
jgi:Tfp pilus assembly protein PilX